MPLTMNREVFITTAITGSGATQDKSPHVPRSPEQIANSAIEAAKAGAAIVHCHVRDPQSGMPSRDPKLYRELTDRIRDSDTDVVLNLTAGMGGDIVFGNPEQPFPLNSDATDMIGASERMAHVVECLPEICTLDCGTMNFAEADYVMTNTPGMLRAMGQMMTDLGVRPEIEAFDTGHLWFATQLVKEGILQSPAMVQLCMGVPWGAPNDMNTFMAMVNNIPDNWFWSAFSLGRDQMPYVAAAVLAGGNVRVGLEDNIFLERGVLATNAQLVDKAVGLIEGLGGKYSRARSGARKTGLNQASPKMNNPQKTVLVTGGAAGIGLAMAEAFLTENVCVAICDADPEAVTTFQRLYPDSIARVADVTSEIEMNAFLGEVESSWGGADVVCANAGTGGPAGKIEDLNYDDWQRYIATNVHGSFLTCRWAARVMRERGNGLIILTSSTAGLMGYPLRSPYAAAKWAIVGLCKTLAMELGSAGVRVNAICPGSVEGERMDRVIFNEAEARGISEDEVRASYVTGVSMKTWVSAQDIASSAVFLHRMPGPKFQTRYWRLTATRRHYDKQSEHYWRWRDRRGLGSTVFTQRLECFGL